MFDLSQLKEMLGQYTGATAAQPPQNVHRDFDDAAQNAPPETLADGVNQAFNSDQTAPFHQMVSQLFSSGNAQQRTGLLQKLLGAVDPSALPAGVGSSPGLASLLGNTTVTAAQAQQLPPQAVEQLARHAQSQNPSVVQEISGFVAQHPGWVKTLGAGVLTVVLSRMAHHA
jgi:hypothetical protein